MISSSLVANNGIPSHLTHNRQDAPPRIPRRIPKLANPLIVPDDQPCPENKTMFQGFEWYCPADHKHWQRLAKVVPDLAALGITSMWIPPATKAGWSGSNGYDIYDLYDLGEFNQKGMEATKWGTKEELTELVDIANAHGIGILFDTILNHKAAADHTETVRATKVDPHGRDSLRIRLLRI
jgi:alpha-amylase